MISGTTEEKDSTRNKTKSEKVAAKTQPQTTPKAKTCETLLTVKDDGRTGNSTKLKTKGNAKKYRTITVKKITEDIGNEEDIFEENICK